MAFNEGICALVFVATLSTSFHMSHELSIGSPSSKDSYSNLLDRIVNINRQRLNIMKELSELQDYHPLRGPLRSRDVDGDVMGLAFVDKDSKPDPRDKNNNIIESKDDGVKNKRINKGNPSTQSEKENIYGDVDNLLLTKDQAKMLRASWNSSCNKKAAKTCKDACVKAIKAACEDYSCKGGLKSKVKKLCKTKCNENFLDEH